MPCGDDPYAELRAQYRAILPARLEAIERACAGLASGTLPDDARLALQREIHSIAGSGETFCLPEVSRAAREAEALLEAPGTPDWRALQARIARLRDAAGTELAAKTSREPGV